MPHTDRLPGAELVDAGLRDLAQNLLSDEALAVLAAGPRLRRAGVDVPERPDVPDASQRLYLSLGEQFGARAHGRHHAVMRRLTSYAAARASTGRR